MGSSWTRGPHWGPPSKPNHTVLYLCTDLQWLPQQGEADCGLACAQMILRTLDGAGNCPQPAVLLAIGEKLPPQNSGASGLSDENEESDCGCSNCLSSCASFDDTRLEDSSEERRGSSRARAPSVTELSPVSGELAASEATPPSPANEASRSRHDSLPGCCLCSIEGEREELERGGQQQEEGLRTARPPCPLEKSLFRASLTHAPSVACLYHARQLVRRAAKGSWTIDLLLLLQHLPCAIATNYTGYNPTHANKPFYKALAKAPEAHDREARRVSAQFRRAERLGLQVVTQMVSRASLAWEILQGRVAIVLVDEGRLAARNPLKVPPDQYDGHFVIVCGVALTPAADQLAVLQQNAALPSGTCSGCAEETAQGAGAASERPSGNSSVPIDAAQHAFSAGVRACQVRAFLFRDPLHPQASWITPERLDISRGADGTDGDLLFVQMPSQLQNAWVMAALPSCSR